VPYHWTSLPSSPPQARRDEVAEICTRHGARLCEGQLFYDHGGTAHALIEVPSGAAKQEALFTELKAHKWVGLVHADGKAAGHKPPGSGPSAKP